MMDFTTHAYRQLLQALIQNDSNFQSFTDYLCRPLDKCVILRHDVDLMASNSLTFAKIEAEYNIKGVYYFRAVPESWKEDIILEIADLGHEIGYHYESLTTCHGDLEKGIKDFEKNLFALRELVQVTTICMHGSPMSPHDSKDLWKYYNYRDYGIIGEPYFDLDFTRFFYLTDTGRRWDGDSVSVRDKVNSAYRQRFNATSELIEAAKNSLLPDQIMFTLHPQRWNDNYFLWIKEYLFQNVKNVIKRHFYVPKEQSVSSEIYS